MSECPACGAAFSCEPGGACWCAKLPPQPLSPEATACFCPKCLAEKIESTKTSDARRDQGHKVGNED